MDAPDLKSRTLTWGEFVLSPWAFLVVGVGMGIGGLVNADNAYSNGAALARSLFFSITSAAFIVGATILGSRPRRSAG